VLNYLKHETRKVNFLEPNGLDQMDTVKGALFWPVVTLFQYVRFTLGCVICFLPVLYARPREFFDLFVTLARLPLGRYVFSGVVSFFAPYSSSVGPFVKDLSSQGCVVQIQDWPWMRNPFSSVHAIALANLGEQVGGILMVCLLQRRRDLRAIPTRVDTVYAKKARGLIEGRSDAISLDFVGEEKEIQVVGKMFDSAGQLVATTTVYWTVRRIIDKKSQ